MHIYDDDMDMERRDYGTVTGDTQRGLYGRTLPPRPERDALKDGFTIPEKQGMPQTKTLRRRPYRD